MQKKAGIPLLFICCMLLPEAAMADGLEGMGMMYMLLLKIIALFLLAILVLVLQRLKNKLVVCGLNAGYIGLFAFFLADLRTQFGPLDFTYPPTLILSGICGILLFNIIRHLLHRFFPDHKTWPGLAGIRMMRLLNFLNVDDPGKRKMEDNEPPTK